MFKEIREIDGFLIGGASKSSKKFIESDMELPITLGKTISNETFIVDLTKMPHLLMAGATGQGKSVGINAILTSILYKKHPAEVKFVLVDPKKIELSIFNKIEETLNSNIILAKINGLNPNPGAWFKYKNERYKVWKAKISNTGGLQGSTIDNNLTIACKDKSISILEIQKEGKSRQSTDQFLLGSKIPKGEKIA